MEYRWTTWKAKTSLVGPDFVFRLDLCARRMDAHGFASLAHLQILLVPVGSISLSVFDKHVAEIRSFESLRLGDIPVDSKNERGMSFC